MFLPGDEVELDRALLLLGIRWMSRETQLGGTEPEQREVAVPAPVDDLRPDGLVEVQCGRHVAGVKRRR